MKTELLELTAAELARYIEAGSVDPHEVLDSYAQWIGASGDLSGAFLAIDFDIARRDLGQALSSRGPLAGVPLAVKDLIHVAGFPTTCGSRILEGYRPPFEATVIERLRAAGAVFYGKLNMDEFAMGSSNENSAYKPVHNPWDLARAPGGSSGGCAAAVAARQTPATLGSDTGGSIRQPASLCGITGLKPTYGRVSRYGLVAFASSLDQIGPMARTAEDCALLLQVIGGYDARDCTSDTQPIPDAATALRTSIKGLRIGLPSEYFAEGLHPEVDQAVHAVAEWFRSSGAQIKTISLPTTPWTTATYYLVATAEASSNLGRYDGVKFGLRCEGHGDLYKMYAATRGAGFGREVKRRIMLGTFALSSGYYEAYYGKAQRARTRIRRDFDSAFAEVDLILTPTSPTTAFCLGEKIADPLAMYLSDIYTNACNLAGIPGIAFPCGFDAAGLPIGAQLMGPAWSEPLLLAAVHRYQQETAFHRALPRLHPTKVASA